LRKPWLRVNSINAQVPQVRKEGVRGRFDQVAEARKVRLYSRSGATSRRLAFEGLAFEEGAAPDWGIISAPPPIG